MKFKIGRERIYNNNFNQKEKVVQWDVLHIKTEQDLILEFISTNSKYRQGVRLAIDVGEGNLEVNGIKARAIRLWEDTAPSKVHIRCLSSEGLLSIYNVFDLGNYGNGGARSLLDSCGMLVEQKENIIIYHCNDSGFVSDFDKLVFQIEILE